MCDGENSELNMKRCMRTSPSIVTTALEPLPAAITLGTQALDASGKCFSGESLSHFSPAVYVKEPVQLLSVTARPGKQETVSVNTLTEDHQQWRSVSLRCEADRDASAVCLLSAAV